uniref:LD12812p n=1 Tax=Drosophila melanogaster TaxID=7227 RepID=Q95RS9_DROME|nr:LD12812p [Drosophila melanogaster]
MGATTRISGTLRAAIQAAPVAMRRNRIASVQQRRCRQTAAAHPLQRRRRSLRPVLCPRPPLDPLPVPANNVCRPQQSDYNSYNSNNAQHVASNSKKRMGSVGPSGGSNGQRQRSASGSNSGYQQVPPPSSNSRSSIQQQNQHQKQQVQQKQAPSQQQQQQQQQYHQQAKHPSPSQQLAAAAHAYAHATADTDSSATPRYDFSQYVPIQTLEVRRRYKTEFESDYDEYRKLLTRVEDVRNRFQDLSERLESARRCDNGYGDYDHIKRQIVCEYERINNDRTIGEDKERFDYLHAKLAHIKQLVMDYDKTLMSATMAMAPTDVVAAQGPDPAVAKAAARLAEHHRRQHHAAETIKQQQQQKQTHQHHLQRHLQHHLQQQQNLLQQQQNLLQQQSVSNSDDSSDSSDSNDDDDDDDEDCDDSNSNTDDDEARY